MEVGKDLLTRSQPVAKQLFGKKSCLQAGLVNFVRNLYKVELCRAEQTYRNVVRAGNFMKMRKIGKL